MHSAHTRRVVLPRRMCGACEDHSLGGGRIMNPAEWAVQFFTEKPERVGIFIDAWQEADEEEREAMIEDLQLLYDYHVMLEALKAAENRN